MNDWHSILHTVVYLSVDPTDHSMEFMGCGCVLLALLDKVRFNKIIVFWTWRLPILCEAYFSSGATVIVLSFDAKH